MGMKKRWIFLAAAAVITLSVWSASANEVIDETNLSGDTTVTGSIEVPDTDAAEDTDGADETEDKTLPEDIIPEEENMEPVDDGSVTYVISIPGAVDFGTLNQSDSSGSTVLHRSVNVAATTMEGLREGQGVSVYVQDGVTGSADFRLYGTGAANSGKSFPYSVLMGGSPVGQNGNLVTTFYAAGQAAILDLQFNQAQLPPENLADWAGDYTGTLHFYSELTGAGEP